MPAGNGYGSRRVKRGRACVFMPVCWHGVHIHMSVKQGESATPPKQRRTNTITNNAPGSSPSATLNGGRQARVSALDDVAVTGETGSPTRRDMGAGVGSWLMSSLR